MNYYVADTHALFWYLIASPRLGAKALSAFKEAERGEALIYLPAIVFAELYYLNEKLRLPLDFASGMNLLRQGGQFIFVSFEAEDALEFDNDSAVPEMHDRMIVGVARRLNATCISLDLSITQSGLVNTIW